MSVHPAWKPARPRLPALLTSPARCLPDFLIIGAQKAGTTSLFEYLSRNDAVWGVPCKECHFFTARWRPALLYRAFFPLRRRRRRMEAAAGRAVLLGEATPYYLFHPETPARVARLLPYVRIVALLREPVARAYSHYRHNVRLGLEDLSFEEALDREASRIITQDGFQHHTYAARGLYAEQLRRWFDHVDRSRMLVLFAEDLFEDPAGVTARVESFLDLPSGAGGPFDVRNVGPPAPPLAEATRQRLQALYGPANRELESLLGVPLPWPV